MAWKGYLKAMIETLEGLLETSLDGPVRSVGRGARRQWRSPIWTRPSLPPTPPVSALLQVGMDEPPRPYPSWEEWQPLRAAEVALG